VKRILSALALLLTAGLALPAFAADAVRPIMPAPFFDLVCAGATISCTLLNPTFSGTSTFTGTIRSADGTAAVPAWSFTLDPTMGFYRAGGSSLGFSTGGAIRGLWDTSGLMLGTGAYRFGTAPGAAVDLSLTRGGTTGALRVLSGTAPTASGTTCGTAPTITGNNTNGAVTLGSTPSPPCIIVFNGTWTTAPHCHLNPEVLTTGTTTVRATGITTTQFTITTTAALVATDKVTWWCVGE